EARGAAAHPGDAVRLDRHVHGQGMGQRHRAVRGLAHFRLPRRGPRDRLAVPNHRLGRRRAVGGLSEGGYGAINIAMHAPLEFSLVESWSGYESAAHNHSIFGRTLAGLATNTPLDLLRSVSPTLRRNKTYFWFYSGSDDSLQQQNRDFAT